jgi:hypothetical protein
MVGLVPHPARFQKVALCVIAALPVAELSIWVRRPSWARGELQRKSGTLGIARRRIEALRGTNGIATRWRASFHIGSSEATLRSSIHRLKTWRNVVLMVPRAAIAFSMPPS